MNNTNYKLTEDDQKAIEFHNLTFAQINKIGLSILDYPLSGNIIKDSLIPIRSILYRLLELNDTLSVLISNSVVSTAFPLIRYEFELLAQLSFILSDKKNISEKSMLYYYCDVRQRFLPSGDNSFNNYMENSRIFHKIHENVSLIKNHEKMSWHSLYERKNISFKSLCEKVGLEKLYLKLYPHLSSDVHGTSCLEANTKCFEEGGKYYLQKFRIFERHHTVMTQHIDFMRQAFNLFPKVFEVSNELQDEIIEFYNSSDIYVEGYSLIKGSPIDPLYDYAM